MYTNGIITCVEGEMHVNADNTARGPGQVLSDNWEGRDLLN